MRCAGTGLGVLMRDGANSSNTPDDESFDGRENIVLRDKTHFEIELIELARRAVGAGVFIPVAGGDLEIAVETRHHDDLFEHLRGLRKRVKFAGMASRGHEEIARAFGAGCRQRWSLIFHEAQIHHAAADAGYDFERSTILACILLRRRSRNR